MFVLEVQVEGRVGQVGLAAPTGVVAVVGALVPGPPFVLDDQFVEFVEAVDETVVLALGGQFVLLGLALVLFLLGGGGRLVEHLQVLGSELGREALHGLLAALQHLEGPLQPHLVLQLGQVLSLVVLHPQVVQLQVDRLLDVFVFLVVLSLHLY